MFLKRFFWTNELTGLTSLRITPQSQLKSNRIHKWSSSLSNVRPIKAVRHLPRYYSSLLSACKSASLQVRSLQVRSLQVCSLQVCKSASLQSASLQVCSLHVSHTGFFNQLKSSLIFLLDLSTFGRLHKPGKILGIRRRARQANSRLLIG